MDSLQARVYVAEAEATAKATALADLEKILLEKDEVLKKQYIQARCTPAVSRENARACIRHVVVVEKGAQPTGT